MKALVCGYGSIGKRHHKILQDLYPQIKVDIHDPYLGYEVDKFGTYDVGLICTDTSSHLSQALAIKNKCGLLFIEKPLHSSLQDIKGFEESLHDANIHVGCNVRYTAAIDELKAIKEECSMVRITAMSNLLKWRDDPEKRAYSFHRSKGGGVLVDFIHEPDYISHCFGLPKQTSVSEKRLHGSITVDSMDSCMMLWEYEDKMVSFCLSYGSIDYVRKIEVLKKDSTSVNIEIKKEDIEKSYVRQWKDLLSSGLSKNSYNDCLRLYDMILED